MGRPPDIPNARPEERPYNVVFVLIDKEIHP